MPPKMLLINVTAVENKVAELGLKQWWLAEKLGVSERSVLRWLNGQVKKVHVDSLTALAGLLNSSLDDITVNDESMVYASSEMQKQAAQMIEEANLYEVFAGRNQWPLFESIIKSTMHPNLPLHRLGLMYILIAMAKLKQNDLDSALTYSQRAKEIGIKTNNRILLARSEAIAGRCHSTNGRFKDAVASWEKYKEHSDYLDQEARTEIEMDFAAIFQHQCDFETAVSILRNSISFFKEAKDFKNLATAYVNLGDNLTDLGKIPEAIKVFTDLVEIQQDRKNPKGEGFARLLLSRLEAIAGNVESASRELEQGTEYITMAGYSKDDVILCRTRAQVAVAKKDYDRARSEIVKSFDSPQMFDLLKADFLKELARIEVGAGNHSEAESALGKANAIFSRLGYSARVVSLEHCIRTFAACESDAESNKK